MVCSHSSISVNMAKSLNSIDLKSRQVNQLHRNKRSPNSHSVPACPRSRSVVVDVVILIAVVGACGFLLYPYAKLLLCKSTEIVGAIVRLMKAEIHEDPWFYGALGLGLSCATTAALAISICGSTKCGKPGCRGLRNAAEFDIQLETEECGSAKDGGVKKGLFELNTDHHRELEAELKKMAPPNGRVVLVFRARCGCPVGRMEVPGPAPCPKKQRKVKK